MCHLSEGVMEKSSHCQGKLTFSPYVTRTMSFPIPPLDASYRDEGFPSYLGQKPSTLHLVLQAEVCLLALSPNEFYTTIYLLFTV